MTENCTNCVFNQHSTLGSLSVDSIHATQPCQPENKNVGRRCNLYRPDLTARVISFLDRRMTSIRGFASYKPLEEYDTWNFTDL